MIAQTSSGRASMTMLAEMHRLLMPVTAMSTGTPLGATLLLLLLLLPGMKSRPGSCRSGVRARRGGGGSCGSCCCGSRVCGGSSSAADDTAIAMRGLSMMRRSLQDTAARDGARRKLFLLLWCTFAAACG